jgi:signal transduction histidine kinase
MKISRLNSIATRIAVTIIAAIVLGIALELALALGVSYLRNAHQPTRFAFVPPSLLIYFNVRNNPQNVTGRITMIFRALAPATEAGRQSLIAALSEPDMQISLRAAPLDGKDGSEDGRLNDLRRFIALQLGEQARSLRVLARQPASDGPAVAEVEIALPDQTWLVITLPDFLADTRAFRWLLIGPPFVLIAILSILTARRLAAPIRSFAAAAEQLGVDINAQPLAERGPHELRTAIRAFNLMQERLRRFLEDRTQMLAAISHDLRTPLARLRLRAEFVEDREQQRKMFGDIESMNAMIDTTLAFARDDARQEPRKLVGLDVLVEDVCEDAADVGGSVRYLGPRGIEITCRPSAIRRAIANLIDNAVKYGGSARVRILREAKRVLIVIEDSGPGIPAGEQDKVFAPFYRLDPSRSPDKAGVGLGLAVARTIAREHGGDVTLANCDGGGLRACVELPA